MMTEQIEAQDERKPSKPFDPISTLIRHWLKIAVFGSILFVLFSPMALLKEKAFYKAEGKLMIAPSVQTLISQKETNPITGSYNSYVRTQCERITAIEMVEASLAQLDPKIKINLPSAAVLGRKLKAAADNGTYFVAITLEGDRSEGLAEAINTIMTVYIEKDIAEAEGLESRRIKYLQEEGTDLEVQLSDLTDQFKVISNDIGSVAFREAGNIYNTTIESLQRAHIDAYTYRISKENNLKAVVREANAIKALPIDADVEDFVLKSNVATRMDIDTYQQIQSLKESLAGLSDNNPDRKTIEEQIANLSASLDYSKDMLKTRTHQIMLSKRESRLQEKIVIAESEFEAAKSAENQLKTRLDAVISKKSIISNKILDGQQIEKSIEKKQALLTRIEDRVNELRMEARSPGRISIEKLAVPPEGPAGSNFKKLIVVFFILGFGSVTFGCVLFDLTDKRIRSKKDISNAIGAKVTWPISNYLLTRTENIPFSTATRDDSSNVVSKAIHSLAIRLDRERRENNAKLAVFTGVDARSGTSEILVNVAYAMTRLCKRVLVVDANLINPAFDRILLENSGAMGLVEHMREEVDFSESIICSPERQFDVLPAGQLLLMSEVNLVDRSKFPPMFDTLKEIYDFILVDTPPILVSDFTEFILQHADISPLIVQGDRSKHDALFMVGDILTRLQIKAIAVVLNWGAPRERNFAQITLSRILAPITAKLTTSPLWNPRHIYGTLSQDDHQGKRIWLVLISILRQLKSIIKNKKILLSVIGGLLFAAWFLQNNLVKDSSAIEKIEEGSDISIPTGENNGEIDRVFRVPEGIASYEAPKTESVQGSEAVNTSGIGRAVRSATQPNQPTYELIDTQDKDNKFSLVIPLGVAEGDNVSEKQLKEIETNDGAVEDAIGDNHDASTDHLAEEYILSLPSSLYTIQLMGSDDRLYLLNISEFYNISGETTCFQKQNGYSDWYVLIYKLFSDRSEAMDCAENLSPELKANHPWIRKLEDIQKEITDSSMSLKTDL